MNKQRIRRMALGSLGIASFLAIWQFLSVTEILIDQFFLSSPIRASRAIIAMAQDGILWQDLALTGWTVVVGFALCVGLAFPAALLAVRVRQVDYAISPFTWFIYYTPNLAFVPLLILWFGVGTTMLLVLVVLFGFHPIYVNTVRALTLENESLVRMARSFNMGSSRILFRVLLPAAVPFIFAGMKLALGRVVIGVTVGEMFGGVGGIGFRVSYTSQLLRIDQSFGALLVIVVLATVLLSLVTAFERRIMSWRDVAPT